MNNNEELHVRQTIEDCNSSCAGEDKSGNAKLETDVTQDDKGSSAAGNSGQGQGQGGERLEDLLICLHNQIKSSDWLQKNNAEKWTEENPELAKEFMEALDQAKKSS